MFVSQKQARGDLAGVLESDANGCYFYLYRHSGRTAVLGHILICKAAPQFSKADVTIKWREDDTICGLFVADTLIAEFDSNDGSGRLISVPGAN